MLCLNFIRNLLYVMRFLEAQPLNTWRCLSACLPACLSVIQLAYIDDIHDLVILVVPEVWITCFIGKVKPLDIFFK